MVVVVVVVVSLAIKYLCQARQLPAAVSAGTAVAAAAVEPVVASLPTLAVQRLADQCSSAALCSADIQPLPPVPRPLSGSSL